MQIYCSPFYSWRASSVAKAMDSIPVEALYKAIIADVIILYFALLAYDFTLRKHRAIFKITA